MLLLLSLTFFPAAMPPGIREEPAPRPTPVDVLREAYGRLPPATPPAATPPVIEVAVDLAADGGPLELWRHGIGHGGINPLPLPDRVVRGAARLKPRLSRVFIQEFFQVYPEHGRFDWSRLDPYMDALARTGAQVIKVVPVATSLLVSRSPPYRCCLPFQRGLILIDGWRHSTSSYGKRPNDRD